MLTLNRKFVYNEISMITELIIFGFTTVPYRLNAFPIKVLSQ